MQPRMQVSAILSHKSGLMFIWVCENQSSLYLRKCTFPFIFEAHDLVEAIADISGWKEAKGVGFSNVSNNDLSDHPNETGNLLKMVPILHFPGLVLGTERHCGLASSSYIFEASGTCQSFSGVLPILHYLYCLLYILFLSFKFYFIYFFIQQVLISHQFYTHQCIHVNPNHPIHHTTIPTPPRLSPLGVHTFVLYICLNFCPANWLICTIFLGSTYMH